MTTVINPLPIPKPKRFASRQKNPFLPLTLSSSSSGVVWKHFTGYLVGQWIVVFHRGDAEALSDANFGKGALSKFGMAFEDRDWKNVEFPDTDDQPVWTETYNADHFESWEAEEEAVEEEQSAEDEVVGMPQIERRQPFQHDSSHQMKHQMSFRRYRKHLQWRKAALGNDHLTGDIESGLDSEIGTLAPDSCPDGSRDNEPPRKRIRVDDSSKHASVGNEGHEGEEQENEEDVDNRKESYEENPVETEQSDGTIHFSDNYLIYEDSDSEDQDANPDKGKKSNNILQSRDEDPLPLKECLLLAPEEAFFLSYGLGCLTVMSSSPIESSSLSQPSPPSNSDTTKLRPHPFPLLELWRRFCSIDARFAAKYVAYHYYRSRGWVPRCGLKFGVDFLLYVSGPAAYHATFSVIVEEMSHDLKKASSCRETSSAPSASGLSRVTEQVNKDLLLCHVVRPKLDSQTDLESLLSSPNCVKEFRVKEILKKRWIMDTERDQTKGLLLSM